ncbi:MAG: glutamate synthase [Oscillospiraceae bacterium]|nr:glutamate synthase [Oscillospiraceae bacterium]
MKAKGLDFKQLNEQIRACVRVGNKNIKIDDCCGQRFICSGFSAETPTQITINGTPGNALGAYLDGGCTITVNGNAQDAVGDTMNDGKIIIHGNAGDALGYSMRGGSIFVKGDAGYRAGVHAKEYKDKKPVIVIGGKVGSFLGEYLAGGLLIALGSVGGFTGTGMHGGKIYIRTSEPPKNLSAQVIATIAENLDEIRPYIVEFAKHFGANAQEILKAQFYVLKPNAKNPYKQLYVMN